MLLQKAKEEARDKVIDFIINKGYVGSITFNCGPSFCGVNIFVECLKPYGLFVVKPDGSVVDNYGVFKPKAIDAEYLIHES